MRLSRAATAALAVLLSRGTLYAASGQSDKKEVHVQRTQVKSSTVAKESVRRDGEGHVAVNKHMIR